MLPRLTATRYVTPLREGGSLPGIVEADDLGTYVMKFRGAGQGAPVLVAEVLAAALARALEIRTPDLAAIWLDEAIARYEADEEVQDLLTASLGLNLGIDFLPGAFGYDGHQPVDPHVAARILWLDAYTANPDRTWSNPNLLVWHGDAWVIDAGAALWFHHSWASRPPNAERFATRPYAAADHILAGVAAELGADQLGEIGEWAIAAITDDVIDAAVDDVPEEWLIPGEGVSEPRVMREAYRDHLRARREAAELWWPAGGLS